MIFLELQKALAEACPEDRKLTVTIVTGLVTFSSVPRYKDSKDAGVRTFPATDEEIENGDKKLIASAIKELFPKPVTDGRSAEQKALDEIAPEIVAKEISKKYQARKEK